MTGRERVDHAIRRLPLDRVPMYDGFWTDTLSSWEAQGYPAGRPPHEVFDFDIVTMGFDTSMRCPQKLLKREGEFITVQDRHGFTVRKFERKDRAMEYLDHVTKDKETWQALRPRFALAPEGEARLDAKSYFLHMDPYPSWAGAKAQFDSLRATGRWICFAAYGPWEATWRHRGYEALLMDLALDPDWVADMGRAVTDLTIACLKHGLRLGIRPDALWLVDDLACTRGLLFSPDTWRAVFKPLYAELGRFLRGEGIGMWLHCCGNCEPLFQDLIACGLQVIQPLQASAGLDVRQLKARWGGQLTFWGNIDVRAMSGTDEEIEEEIRSKLAVAKAGGGYIYHSDHSVPPEVSYERYRRVRYELLPEYGTYA